MDTAFLVLAAVFGSVAAVIHVAIFFMESVFWSRPGIWRRLGVASQEDATVLQPMAYNQGFYNLFLAIAAALGLLLFAASPMRDVGIGITGVALASMLLASIVLITSSPRLLGAAGVQGIPPLIALVSGTIWVLG